MSPTAVFSCTSEPRNVMVTVVDKLERQGLVARMPHPGDRRAFAVTLTDKARELLRPHSTPRAAHRRTRPPRY